MEDFKPSIVVVVAFLAFCFVAGQFDNHLWRLLVIGAWITLHSVTAAADVLPGIHNVALWLRILYLLVTSACFMFLKQLKPRQKRQGCVFITGADSGMGQATVIHLARTNAAASKENHGSYDCIFAGAFNPESTKKQFKEMCTEQELALIHVVPLDVTNSASVAQAADIVQNKMSTLNSIGLTGLINYHGMAFNGPVAYMPIEMFQKQLDVNFMGNVRMTQSFLPLLKKACSVTTTTTTTTRGRLIFTGTGGGSCSPCPPLLSAYMSSKFAVEAFCHSLRAELHMMNIPIDCAMINPGFVKPTLLMEEGEKLTEKMWEACSVSMGGLTIAKDEYGGMMDHFIKYAAAVPGTHVSEVCKAAEHALTAYRPRSSYKVGIDSKLAPIVGMLPTGVREKISLHGMYGILSPAGTVTGYRL